VCPVSWLKTDVPAYAPPMASAVPGIPEALEKESIGDKK